VEGNEKVTRDNWEGGVQIEGKDGELMTYTEAKSYFPKMKSSTPFPMPPITILPTQEAYEYVLKNAGATLPKRDAVDERIIQQVSTGKIDYRKDIDPDDFYQFEHRRLPKDSYKQGIITDIRQVGGYPEYKGTPYKDNDKDGMPNQWEIKYKLDPNDPSDANGDLNGDGYTNIEKYINGIDPGKKVDWTDLENNHDTLAEKENGLITSGR
jgi:hypothetical protein